MDDKLHDHRKVRRLGVDKLSAIGLWSICGSWSRDNHTEGFVPAEIVQRYDPKERLAGRLVDVLFWESAEQDGEPGYRFHDWEDWQRTEAEITERRSKRSEAGRKGGEASGKQRRSKCEASASADVDDDRSNREASAVPTVEANGNEIEPHTHTHTHTQPQEPSPNGEASSGPRKRGSRIPDDFEVAAEMVSWARENAPDVDGRRETERFRDYWRGKSGKDATKDDWPATWRNWMRKAQDDMGRRPLRAVGDAPSRWVEQ